ncbi:Cytochrome c oxidase subunit 4 [Peltigera leucophlebia]|nr:Cytochrome c oxidase subunit 4 [Peltigera leucophlebia]
MLARRSALTLSRRIAISNLPASRGFLNFFSRKKEQTTEPKETEAAPFSGQKSRLLTPLEEIKSLDDLLPPGAEPGTVPTDLEQSTGLERLEILGKMQGVDIFDMSPLDSSRKGTLDNPIMVKSFGDEQYAGCTGYPVDSHVVIWLTMSRERPIGRCPECGNVLKMEYIGPPDDPHDDGHHKYVEPKTFADYVRPEYR